MIGLFNYYFVGVFLLMNMLFFYLKPFDYYCG